MAAAMASEASGPVARMHGPSEGIPVASPRTRRMSGSAATVAVTSRAKASRSTARAPPAGTFTRSATFTMSESSRRISSFRRPEAVSSRFDLSELEQTSSARSPVLCTGVGRTGRISCSSTRTPRRAACQAASEPARPPPMMMTRVACMECPDGARILARAHRTPAPQACMGTGAAKRNPAPDASRGGRRVRRGAGEAAEAAGGNRLLEVRFDVPDTLGGAGDLDRLLALRRAGDRAGQVDHAFAGVDVDLEPAHGGIVEQALLDPRRDGGVVEALAHRAARAGGVTTVGALAHRDHVLDLGHALGVAGDLQGAFLGGLAVDVAGQRHDAVDGVDLDLAGVDLAVRGEFRLDRTRDRRVLGLGARAQECGGENQASCNESLRSAH